MAIEEDSRKPTEDTKQKKLKLNDTQEQELVHEIVLESLERLQSDIRRIDKAIDLNEDNPRKLAILLNAKSRLQQQVYYGVAILSNPKLKLFSERGSKDLAKRIQRVLLSDSPARLKNWFQRLMILPQRSPPRLREILASEKRGVRFWPRIELMKWKPERYGFWRLAAQSSA